MSRISPIKAATASDKQKEILATVQKAMGGVPNLISTMAQSPTVAKAYLAFSQALSEGLLCAKMRERIALTVAQANDCEYCLAAHSAIGGKAGLTAEDIAKARQGTSDDPQTAAALAFARKVVTLRGEIIDADFKAVRDAGNSEAEIAEIVANVALNLFTNYFNHVADTEVDFPPATCSTNCGCEKPAAYKVFETGSLKDWVKYEVVLPGLGKLPGKLFLKDKLGLTASEMSINAMLPGEGMPIHHTHQENEEVYLFIHGQGQVQINGDLIPVREGTAIRIEPKAERVWRNNGNETLVYIVMQSREHSLRQWGLADGTVPDKPVIWPAA